LVATAYDADAMGAQGPYTAAFGDFQLGLSSQPFGTFDGTWNAVGGVERSEARFRLTGLGLAPVPRVDALWRGTISARIAPGGEPITSVVTQTPDAQTITAQVTFDVPQPVSAAPLPLPISAALLIRPSDGFSLAQAVADSRTVRQQMSSLGVERPADPALRMRHPVVVAWVVPPDLFDDEGWPGGMGGMNQDQRRAARRTAAGQWLAREGIGLVVTA
jgi:hypothetical protein